MWVTIIRSQFSNVRNAASLKSQGLRVCRGGLETSESNFQVRAATQDFYDSKGDDYVFTQIIKPFSFIYLVNSKLELPVLSILTDAISWLKGGLKKKLKNLLNIPKTQIKESNVLPSLRSRGFNKIYHPRV